MARLKTPVETWIAAALDALAAGGPESVRIESLATTLGVSKGGFYWNFANRAELLERALDTWERTVVEDVIDDVERGDGDARAKLTRLFEIAMAAPAYADKAPQIRAELAVRDWARRDDAVARRLRGVDERRMAYMRKLFGEFSTDEEDAEARCLMAFSLFVGQRFIAVSHPGSSRTRVLRRALDQLLR